MILKTILSEVENYCVCQKLRLASRKVTRMYDDAMRPLGITPTQFTLLLVVGNNIDVSLTELADILGMERTTLTRNLKPLEREGLISLSSEGYRRSRNAILSNKGIDLIEEALPLWRSAQESLKTQLGHALWNQLQGDLSKVAEKL